MILAPTSATDKVRHRSLEKPERSFLDKTRLLFRKEKSFNDALEKASDLRQEKPEAKKRHHKHRSRKTKETVEDQPAKKREKSHKSKPKSQEKAPKASQGFGTIQEVIFCQMNQPPYKMKNDKTASEVKDLYRRIRHEHKHKESSHRENPGETPKLIASQGERKSRHHHAERYLIIYNFLFAGECSNYCKHIRLFVLFLLYPQLFQFKNSPKTLRNSCKWTVHYPNSLSRLQLQSQASQQAKGAFSPQKLGPFWEAFRFGQAGKASPWTPGQAPWKTRSGKGGASHRINAGRGAEDPPNNRRRFEELLRKDPNFDRQETGRADADEQEEKRKGAKQVQAQTTSSCWTRKAGWGKSEQGRAN